MGCSANLQAEQERLRAEAEAQRARAEEQAKNAEEQRKRADEALKQAELAKEKAEAARQEALVQQQKGLEPAQEVQKQLADTQKLLSETQQKLEETQLLLRAREAHTEINKVLKSEKEIDIVLAKPVEGEAVKEQQAKMDKVDNIKIDNLQVAYAQEDKLTLNAKTYKRHFRVMYIKDGKAYAFGYYTMEEIDGAAFAMLLKKIFPVVDDQMTKYNVEIKPGKP